MTLPSSRFDQFIQHGLYLRNWSPRTARTYRQGLRRLAIEVPKKADLDAWVMRMRRDGLTPGGCNMYIRTINAYLTAPTIEGKSVWPDLLKRGLGLAAWQTRTETNPIQ